MSKTVHFTSGLPRSCSTLLQNLLAQNPKVYATGSSGVHEMIYFSRSFLDVEEFRTIQNPEEGEQQYKDFVKHGLVNTYNSLTDRPVVVDKSRAWIGSLDLLFQLFPSAKVLVPVRDIRGILSSMEKKRLKHPAKFNIAEKADSKNWTTIEKRVTGWLSSPPISVAIERLHDATRYRDKLHFVHAEELTSTPTKAMGKIWDYLGETFSNHDFCNVKQFTQEHELGWPYGDHQIRSTVTPLEPDWNTVLGKGISQAVANKFHWINEL